MNEVDFLKNERPNEYEVRFRIDGEVCVTINAASENEAKEKAQAMLEDNDFGLELDAVIDAKVQYVWKSPAMYLVTRDGWAMQVSRLREGDLPRQPTDRGF